MSGVSAVEYVDPTCKELPFLRVEHVAQRNRSRGWLHYAQDRGRDVVPLRCNRHGSFIHWQVLVVDHALCVADVVGMITYARDGD